MFALVNAAAQVFISAGREIRQVLVTESNGGQIKLADKRLEQGRVLMSQEVVIVYTDDLSRQAFYDQYDRYVRSRSITCPLVIGN